MLNYWSMPPGLMGEVARAAIVESAPLPRRTFAELEGMYRDVVERLVLYAASSHITKSARLEAEKYREVTYHRLPSHYAYAARLEGPPPPQAEEEGAFSAYPEARGASAWLTSTCGGQTQGTNLLLTPRGDGGDALAA